MTRLAVAVFARYAEILGAATVEVTLPSDATVADLIRALRELPGGDLLPARPLVAVDHRLADATTPVGPKSELALLPPLAGG
jgi:molybdopterin converting factor small subunit